MRTDAVLRGEGCLRTVRYTLSRELALGRARARSVSAKREGERGSVLYKGCESESDGGVYIYIYEGSKMYDMIYVIKD